MIKSNFREWTSDRIDETFGTKQIDNHPALDSWLSFEYELKEWEKIALLTVQKPLIKGAVGWNEVELENKFISPMFMLAGVYGDNFGYFLERDLAANIDDYELSGRFDGMVASGVRNPKKPFFCLNEYKRLTDPDGEPQGQVLMAMLVAQQHNNTPTVPLHGCYIVVGGKFAEPTTNRKINIVKANKTLLAIGIGAGVIVLEIIVYFYLQKEKIDKLQELADSLEDDNNILNIENDSLKEYIDNLHLEVNEIINEQPDLDETVKSELKKLIHNYQHLYYDIKN